MTLLVNSASELEDFANNTYLLKVLEGKIRPRLDIGIICLALLGEIGVVMN